MNVLTTADAAKQLGVTACRVRQLYSQGRLRGQKITERMLLLDPQSVSEFQRLPRGRKKAEKPAKNNRKKIRKSCLTIPSDDDSI